MKNQFYKVYKNMDDMYDSIRGYEEVYDFEILRDARSKYRVRFVKKPNLELILKT